MPGIPGPPEALVNTPICRRPLCPRLDALARTKGRVAGCLVRYLEQHDVARIETELDPRQPHIRAQQQSSAVTRSSASANCTSSSVRMIR